MRLTQLDIKGIRNLQDTSITPAPTFNLITGDNGAGKSSLLEAIHLLSTGHSFRTRKTRELICHNADRLSVISKIYDRRHAADHRAGINKHRNGETQVKLDYEPLHSMAQMTRLLPVKALFPDSHKLIQEGPSIRRQFLDWGLFHVEHDFFGQWKNYKRALDQRNQSLRKQLPESEIVAWNAELSESGENITLYRNGYVRELRAWLAEYVRKFGIQGCVTVEYRQGWSGEKGLCSTLSGCLTQCQRFRTTTVGPHRAELSIEFNSMPARQVLSRGQQKLLVYALHFAQLAMYTEKHQQKAIVLSDDLLAELDENHRNCVLFCLHEMNLQTFITANTRISFPENAAAKVFHVKHGDVQEVI